MECITRIGSTKLSAIPLINYARNWPFPAGQYDNYDYRFSGWLESPQIRPLERQSCKVHWKRALAYIGTLDWSPPEMSNDPSSSCEHFEAPIPTGDCNFVPKKEAYNSLRPISFRSTDTWEKNMIYKSYGRLPTHLNYSRNVEYRNRA